MRARQKRRASVKPSSCHAPYRRADHRPFAHRRRRSVYLSTVPKEQPTPNDRGRRCRSPPAAMRIKPLLIASAALARRTSGDRAAGRAPHRAGNDARRPALRRRRRPGSRPPPFCQRPPVSGGGGRKRRRGVEQYRSCRRRSASGRISRLRAPRSVGGRALDPRPVGLGDDPWGGASGAFLSTLMRRMDTPLASRWAHIALRDALLAKARAPRDVNPVDWVAERAWLLLRMGEADAARMLVAEVDTDRFTPKMVQVAVQSALASADPPALCPIEDGIRKYDPKHSRRWSRRCARRWPASRKRASAQIDDARRHGRIGGIDLALAEKVVGAGADTGRAVTIEWEPVDQPDRLALRPRHATGMMPPDRLLKRASPQTARVPGAGAAADAAAAARIGADRCRPRRLFLAVDGRPLFGDLRFDRSGRPCRAPTPGSCARRSSARTRPPGRRHPPPARWRQGPLQKEASAGTGGARGDADRARSRAARRCAGPHLGDARRRLRPCRRALGARRAPDGRRQCRPMLGDARAWRARRRQCRHRVRPDRQLHRPRQEPRTSCAARCSLPGLPALAGSAPTPPIRSIAATASASGGPTSWTRMIDAAAGRGQGGTVLVLTGTGFQTPSLERVPAGPHVPCDLRPQTHRPGLHRADDRGGGPVTDVTVADVTGTERWSTASST